MNNLLIILILFFLIANFTILYFVYKNKHMKENISEDFKDELHLIRNSFSDSLRNKFKDDKEKLKELDDINLYIEEIEKIYQKVS